MGRRSEDNGPPGCSLSLEKYQVLIYCPDKAVADKRHKNDV